MKIESYSINEITHSTGGVLIHYYNNSIVQQVIYDSRNLFVGGNSIFIALKTAKRNGHDFIEEAYQKGVRNFLVSEKPNFVLEEANFILVPDTLAALHSWASFHREKLQCPVIAITGSNGKTILKEWLFFLLSPYFRIVRSPRSFNSQIGVPLSLLQVSASDKLAIIEAGISCPGEMKTLEKMIKPDICIITNVLRAHANNFLDREQHINEKLILAKHASTIIYCADDQLLSNQIALLPGQKIHWSSKMADFSFSHETNKLIFYHLGFQTVFPVNVSDSGSIQNLSHAIACSFTLGIQPEKLILRVSEIAPVEMRFEMIEGVNNCKILNDTYSLDYHSFALAVDYVNRNAGELKKTVILSDFPELNLPEKAFYKKVSTLLNDAAIHRVVLITPQTLGLENTYNGKWVYFSDVELFLNSFHELKFENEFILIKGKRNARFEKITEAFELKKHATHLKVDLGAIQFNLNYYQSLLKPRTKTMVMVKALAYGSGSREISHLLQFNKVDYLAVAYADEGADLRRLGVSLPIMVMNCAESDYSQLVKYNLQPEIYNFSILDSILDYLKKQKLQNFAVHLKIDSGMHRLGFLPEQIDELIFKLKKCNYQLQIESVFSHLSGADDPSQDDFTRIQIQSFEGVAEKIKKQLNISPLMHILNSSGIERFPQHAFDMVRLGIGLHGIGVTQKVKNNLITVHEFVSRISHLQKVKKGEHIGYGRKGIAQNDLTVAVIPVGYADGYFRAYGNGVGKVLINQHLAPVIGNVCMDMIMVDVSELFVNVNDEVLIFGKNLPVTDVASWINTIPYELLTGVSVRVKRVYLENV